MNNLTYYLSANSCSGYTSFFDDFVKSIRKIIVLKNISKNAKDNLFKEITDILDCDDISYDICLRCGSISEVDAVILKDFSTVIACEELFTGEIPLYADIVDFSDILSLDYDVQKNIEDLRKRISTVKTRLFSHLSDAKLIHDRWEKIYISNIDFDVLDLKGDKLIDDIFSGVTDKQGVPTQVHRFFGSLLPRGNINFIDELTEGFEKRIFIKGRPGTGKSTFLKKVCDRATKQGYSTEVYHCSFDVKSLDMIIVRDLKLAVFDSTSPHEIFPSRNSDSIFDIYDIAVNEDTDESYADELMHITSQYNQSIKKAKECLYTSQMLKKRYDEIIYTKEVSDNALNKVISLASLNNG